MSAAIISRVTAAVDSRSSHKAIGKIAQRHEVARELAHRLGARPVAAGEGQRQTDHQPAHAMGVDQREQPRHVLAKAPPADGVERGGDDEARVGEREADRLGADIEARSTAAPPGTASRSAAGSARIMAEDSLFYVS